MNTVSVDELSSEWTRNRRTALLVQNVFNGVSLVNAGGVDYRMKAKLAGFNLKAGQIVLAAYNGNNQGAQVYEILGFTDTKIKYGEGGVAFQSIKEAMRAKGVKTLTELENLPVEEYGQRVYMVVKDVQTGESGPWFYLYKARWAIGSSADALRFGELEKFDPEAYQALKNKAARIEDEIKAKQAELAEIYRLLGEE